MSAFTNLEAAVLLIVCETDGKQLTQEQRQILRSQLATAVVVERDNTGHGFYTEFEVDRSLPQLEVPSMIDAPTMGMKGLGDGNALSFILWTEGGYPTTLEGFQSGDRTGVTVDLHNYDLAELSYTESSWG